MCHLFIHFRHDGLREKEWGGGGVPVWPFNKCKRVMDVIQSFNTTVNAADDAKESGDLVLSLNLFRKVSRPPSLLPSLPPFPQQCIYISISLTSLPFSIAGVWDYKRCR